MVKLLESIIQYEDFFKILRSLLKSGKINSIVIAQTKKEQFSLAPLIADSAESLTDFPLISYFIHGYDTPDTPAGVVHRKLNGARDQKVAYVGRPEDYHALIELSKRKQVKIDNIFSIIIEDFGTVNAKKFSRQLKKQKIDLGSIVGERLTKNGIVVIDNSGSEISVAFDSSFHLVDNFCSREEVPSDLYISTVGLPDSNANLYIAAGTARGEEMLNAAEVNQKPLPKGYKKKKTALLREICEGLDERLRNEQEDWDALEATNKLDWMSKCTMCGMCITTCPVCFCKDCNLKAQRKEKSIDSVTYQLSRLAHVGDACIGCGRCNSICPVNIPLGKYLLNIRKSVKSAFNYEAGASFDSAPPRSNRNVCDDLKNSNE